MSEAIYGYSDPSRLWMDLGKPEQLAEAEKLILPNFHFIL
jgi:hypothetical protein